MDSKDLKDTLQNDYLGVTDKDQLVLGRDLVENIVERLVTPTKDVNIKLELFRRVSSLGIYDIEKAFPEDTHIHKKYEQYREDEGANGNFKFLFSLDSDYADKFFDYLGLRSLSLEKKDSLPQSVKYIKE